MRSASEVQHELRAAQRELRDAREHFEHMLLRVERLKEDLAAARRGAESETVT